jgi:hemerythrin-like metal-binding protein
MEFITWTESLSVGVKAFDSEHRQLIDLINKLNHSLSVGAASRLMSITLDSLASYTAIHFAHEEEYMALYDYPLLESHKTEHAELNAQVAEFKERLASGRGSFSLELMIFLRDWLTNHIMKSDMKYKDFFIVKGL